MIIIYSSDCRHLPPATPCVRRRKGQTRALPRQGSSRMSTPKGLEHQALQEGVQGSMLLYTQDVWGTSGRAW